MGETQVRGAEDSLRARLRTRQLSGRSFLDVGSGSGLFSLAARRLGATVYSFDYDAQSVACTQQLKERFLPDDTAWMVAQGSILDQAYLQHLGQFDVVYSWCGRRCTISPTWSVPVATYLSPSITTRVGSVGIGRL